MVRCLTQVNSSHGGGWVAARPRRMKGEHLRPRGTDRLPVAVTREEGSFLYCGAESLRKNRSDPFSETLEALPSQSTDREDLAFVDLM